MAGQLRNIRFAHVSVSILSIEHFSRVLIQWDLAPTAQSLKNLKFFVDRGESPNAMMQLNARGIPSSGLQEYVDETADLRDMNKVYYWRVRAVEYVGDTPVKMFASQPVNVESDLDLEGLYVIEEHAFAHRYVYGVPAMVFKKIRDGAYCTNCWDRILKRVTKSNCTTCYGSGRVGGYYPPIDAWMSFEPDPKVEQVVEWGRRQSSQTDIQFINYPLLSPGDLILELQPNRMFRVSNVRAPEKNRNTMLQMARIDAVYPSDIEYKIEVPEDRRRVLLKQLDDRERGIDFPDGSETLDSDPQGEES